MTCHSKKHDTLTGSARNFGSAALFLFLTISLLFSCRVSQRIASKKTENAAIALSSSSPLKMIVSSTNLSEDMSTLSTNNDELLLMVYRFVDSTVSGPPLAYKHMLFDKVKRSDTLVCDQPADLLGKDLIIFLLEMDSEKKAEQVDPLIRKHYAELAKAYLGKNYLEIERLIGDDDILGIEMLSALKYPGQIQFADIHRMDRFEYTIRIGN